MKRIIKKGAFILLITAGIVSCSKDKDIAPGQQESMSIPMDQKDNIPTFPPPKKKRIALSVE